MRALVPKLFLFISLGLTAHWSFAQTSVQLDISETEALVRVKPSKNASQLEKNSLGQIHDGPDECELKFPYPNVAVKKDPYAENGPEVCSALQIRGQRMQCEIDALVLEKPTGSSVTTGAKIELASWARCNSKVANLLIAGYYIPASEIERRLQICSSNFYADPGKTPKLGWYQRLMKWYASNDLTPPPSDATLEASIKQSTPIDSQQDMAGLMKCEWMFSRSKTPFVDPLPGGSQVDRVANPAPTPKKPTPKKSTVKTPS